MKNEQLWCRFATILIHARRAFHNYSLFIIHYSLFTEKYNAPIYDRGVKIRGTTLIRFQRKHLRCSVTGAPVPVFPGGLEVAEYAVHKGLAPSPSRLDAVAYLRFRIAFAFPRYSTTNGEFVNGFPLFFPKNRRKTGGIKPPVILDVF